MILVRTEIVARPKPEIRHMAIRVIWPVHLGFLLVYLPTTNENGSISTQDDVLRNASEQDLPGRGPLSPAKADEIDVSVLDISEYHLGWVPAPLV